MGENKSNAQFDAAVGASEAFKKFAGRFTGIKNAEMLAFRDGALLHLCFLGEASGSDSLAGDELKLESDFSDGLCSLSYSLNKRMGGGAAVVHAVQEDTITVNRALFEQSFGPCAFSPV